MFLQCWNIVLAFHQVICVEVDAGGRRDAGSSFFGFCSAFNVLRGRRLPRQPLGRRGLFQHPVPGFGAPAERRVRFQPFGGRAGRLGRERT